MKYLILLFFLFSSQVGFSQNPSEVYRKTKDSVVLILANFGKGQTKGTGSIISPGKVLTNAHVVLSKDGKLPDRLVVLLAKDNANDGSVETYKNPRIAKVSISDQKLDLALLEVAGIEEELAIEFANSNGVQIGDQVLAIGHPENGGLWSLTSGRIGARIKNHAGISGQHVFQTETSLNRGNSGGPLLNFDGKLIGINTSIARKSEDGLAITGINFSVQSNVAVQWLSRNGVQLKNSLRSNPDSIQLSGIKKIDESKKRTPEEDSPEQQDDKKNDLKEVENEDSRVLQPNLLAKPRDDGLLTKPKPFNDEDLFRMFMDEQEDEMDRLMKIQENEIDKSMDELFNSF